MARYRNPESELNIRRIDSTTVHGFQFHAQRMDLRITRLFSDTVSGGKDLALGRAQTFRDTTIPKLPLRTCSWGPRTHASNSNTGIMGISITESLNSDGSTRTYVQSTASNPGLKNPINKKIRIMSDEELGDAIEQLRVWRATVLSGTEF